MEKTPLAMRKHVALFGETNAGKSSLFNALLGQDLAIVSDEKGTTTDPVTKALELSPFGAVALIDTAGLGDTTHLGKSRMEKTNSIIRRCDLGLYVADIVDFDEEKYLFFAKQCRFHILVFAKSDLAGNDEEDLLRKYKNAAFVSIRDKDTIDRLKGVIAQKLSEQEGADQPLISDLLPKDSTVILVVPIDSAAPKGRLILPQVQLIRECLDSGIKALVVRDTELESALSELKRTDLVVTDSQAFKYVDEIVPDSIPVTSFSMLLARQKGNFSAQLQGVEAIENLPDNANILVLEGCTHNSTHEDIGRIKIPKLLSEKTGRQLHFDYYAGYDIPKDFSRYQLVILCGSCMLNKKEVEGRILLCEQNGIPVTNYGIVLAYANGMLERAAQIFTS